LHGSIAVCWVFHDLCTSFGVDSQKVFRPFRSCLLSSCFGAQFPLLLVMQPFVQSVAHCQMILCKMSIYIAQFWKPCIWFGNFNPVLFLRHSLQISPLVSMWHLCLFKRVCLQHMVGVTDGFPVVDISSFGHFIARLCLCSGSIFLCVCVCESHVCFVWAFSGRQGVPLVKVLSQLMSLQEFVPAPAALLVAGTRPFVQEEIQTLNMCQVLSQKWFKSIHSGFCQEKNAWQEKLPATAS